MPMHVKAAEGEGEGEGEGKLGKYLVPGQHTSATASSKNTREE